MKDPSGTNFLLGGQNASRWVVAQILHTCMFVGVHTCRSRRHNDPLARDVCTIAFGGVVVAVPYDTSSPQDYPISRYTVLHPCRCLLNTPDISGMGILNATN